MNTYFLVIPASLFGVAFVLDKYFHRHDNKQFTIRWADGTTGKATGYTKAETKRLASVVGPDFEIKERQ